MSTPNAMVFLFVSFALCEFPHDSISYFSPVELCCFDRVFVGCFFLCLSLCLFRFCALRKKKKYMQRLFFSAPLAIDLSCSFIGLSAPFFASASLHVHPHGSVTIHHYSFPFLSMKQDMKLSTKMVEITSSHQRSFFFSKKCTRSLNVHFVLIKYFLFLLTLIGAQFLFACR